jgi:RNA recognition motif-containing protein
MTSRLYIGNLPYSCTEDEVRGLFASIGVEPASIRVIMDRSTGLSKGYGFVEMETFDKANKALKSLSGAVLGERRVVLDHARPNQPVRRSLNG